MLALVLGAPVVSLGLVVAAQAGYLALLSGAALARPRARDGSRARCRMTVLVPAHDEEALIRRCLASLQAQDYPADQVDVVVVADNCTDRTAHLAMEAGARVLVREDRSAPGKGRALRWAMDRLLDEQPGCDALVVVDADSVADRGLLRGLARAYADGAAVVQGEYLALREDAGPRGQLRAAAFLLFHRVRFRGRAALGLPCTLVGNGMLFSREVLQRQPWDAFSSTEDLEYTVTLRLAGVRPVFAETARLQAPVATGGAGAATQRRRWEGGRLELARRRLPGLLLTCVRDRRWELWDLAVDLSVPPLGVLAPLVVAGLTSTALLVATVGLPLVAVAPWVLAAGGVTTHVLLGLRAADAPPEVFDALRHAPRLVLGEFRTRLRLLRDSGATTWVRTARPGEGT